ncbi:MAG: tetratricopeptide repeat protein, partial [Bacteroidales bacterium]|nr:tetratricopeptide repeat protein [Bacteroidales bacterium]
MRLVSIIFQLIIIFPLFSQNNTSTKVDSLLNESYNKFVELQIIESLKLSEKALLLSEETHYENGMMYSYLSIARALQEVGLRKEALEYIEKVEDGEYFKKDAFLQADTYWLRGRIASSQHLYSFEKEYHLKQLRASQNIADFKKRELSIVTAYFYLQNLYVKQNMPDSAIVYQEQLEQRLIGNDSIGLFYKISLYADKGLMYKSMNRFDEAAEQLEKSLKVAEMSNSHFLFYPLQVYGDIEMERGDSAKAISYYNRALRNSIDLNIDHQTMDLHKKISYLLLYDEAT